jgi:hypothetical protein
MVYIAANVLIPKVDELQGDYPVKHLKAAEHYLAIAPALCKSRE